MWPIQLPYGLSKYHRHVQATGRGVALPYGGGPRWQNVTLQQLPYVSLTTSSTTQTTFHSTPGQSHRHQLQDQPRRRRRSTHGFEMGATGSVFQESAPAATAVRKRRKRRRKLESQPFATIHEAVRPATMQRKGKIARRNPLGGGTRPGTRHDLPITIDSDSDNDGDSVAITEERQVSGSRAYSLSPAPVGAAPSTGSAASRASAPSTPPRSVGRNTVLESSIRPSQPYRRRTRSSYEERLVSIEPSTPERLGSSLGNLRLSGPSTLAADAERLRTQSRTILPARPNSPFVDDAMALTLADIKDFTIRRKTAQLMAVAPGLPVADLYHLLMDKNGHFEAAMKDVVRASQAPRNENHYSNTLSPSRAAATPLAFLHRVSEEPKDEAEIKIDFDDPLFTWDNDVPASPPPEPRRQKDRAQKQPKGVRVKSKVSSFIRPTKGTASKETPHKSHIVKCSRRTGDINRGIRATSYDLEFIVPDDEVFGNSDDTYTEASEQSAVSYIDKTDDGTDLLIDMEPEYAYNSDVL